MPLSYVVTLQCYDSTRWTFVYQFPSRFLRLPTDHGLFFFLFFIGSEIAREHINLLWVCCCASPPCLLPDPIALPLVSTGLLTSGSWTSAAPVIKEHWSDIHPRLSSSRRPSALTLFLPPPSPPASFPNPLHLHHRLLLVQALYFSVRSPGEALEIDVLPQESPKHSPMPAGPCAQTSDCRNPLYIFHLIRQKNTQKVQSKCSLEDTNKKKKTCPDDGYV